MARILVADDWPDIRAYLKKTLEKTGGHEVELAQDGKEAIDQLRKRSFDLAILDYDMPGLNGIEVLQKAKREHIPAIIIILTGKGTIPLAVQAIKEGAQDFIEKPILQVKVNELAKRYCKRERIESYKEAVRLDQALEEQCCVPGLRLTDVCAHLDILPGKAMSLIRTQLKSTFRQRLAYHRVERVKKMMAETDNKLSAIAVECGFKNQKRMAEAFKRVEGITPNRYRW